MKPDIRDEDEEGQAGAAEFARMLEQFESSREAETPAIGSQVPGRIVMIGEVTSFVDFGGRSEGAVETIHLRNPDGSLGVKVGDTLSLFVIENRDQVILAPSAKVDPAIALPQLQEALRGGLPVSGKVTGQNAGGLEVEISGLRAFCPFSQVEAAFCPDPSIYLGRTLDFLVTEVAERGKRLVVSRKALLRREEQERIRELLARLKEGAEVEGKVARIEGFGVFVDLGGVDGLIHVSEISHARTENPGAVLAVGQPVRVKVLSITPQEGGRPRIALSMKAILPDPWEHAGEHFREGDCVTGTVARLADFGAFVNLAPGIDGLVHVSEIDHRPVAHPRDVLSVGQTVDVVVLSVDRDRRRISLSIKGLLVAAETADVPASEEVAGDVQPEPVAPASRNPAVGDLIDGRVAGIQPYGVFVDLPAYGPRTRGLLPHEETGEKPRADLGRRFKVGDTLQVEVIDVREDGKIRLSLIRAGRRAEQEAFRSFQERSAPPPGGNTAIAEAMRRAMEKKQ